MVDLAGSADRPVTELHSLITMVDIHMLNRSGSIILSSFAAVWLALAKLNDAPIGWLPIFVSGCFSGVLICLSYRQKREPSLLSATEQQRIGRVFMWSSIGEGIGVLIVINVLKTLGISNRLMAGIALVVGLHFIPIALMVPARMFMLLALILTVVSVIGFTISYPPYAALFVGAMCAATLWSVVCVSILRTKTQTFQ